MGREILVVKRDILFREGDFQGFVGIDFRNFIEIILKNFIYKNRDDVEYNPEWQQPIPYVLIVNPKTKKLFTYKRASDKNYNDQRLRDKWSCGIGGHIDREDVEDPIINAMMRELCEEVVMGFYPEPKIVGYINDDSDSVGKVHFGIVAIVETGDVVEKGDDEMAEGRFMSIQEIEKLLGNPENDIETWTRLSWSFVKNYLNGNELKDKLLEK